MCQVQLPHRLEVDLHGAGRALAVAQIQPVVDAVAAEGVAALHDDGVLFVCLAQWAPIQT